MFKHKSKNKTGIQFRKGIEDSSFSSSTTNNAANADATTIVRELIQNSVDAAKEIGLDKAIIRFEIEEIEQCNLPGIDNLRNAFTSAFVTQTKLSDGILPDIQKQIAAVFENNLKQHSGDILSVMDNGVGLTKNTMKALLADGRSAKSTGGGGAHGYGHLPVLSSSDLRLVYYGGVNRDGSQVASGHCVLAPFRDEHGEDHEKDGYLVKSLKQDLYEPYEFLSDDDIPELISAKIDIISNEWGSGTVVLVPAFNFFKDSKDDLFKSIKKAAATNFFASFAKDEIVIELKKGEYIQKLDHSNIKDALEEFSNEKLSRSFISGSKANDCFNVITTGEDIKFKTDIGIVTGKLELYNNSKTTRIDLCRNGMWIVYNNSPGKRLPRLQNSSFIDYKPFHLVILLEANDGEIHQLVRKSEPPIHDQVDVKRLLPDDQKKLENAFTQINEQIKKKLVKIDSKTIVMDGILTFPIGGSGSGGEIGNYAGEWKPFERKTSLSKGVTPIEIGNEGIHGNNKKNWTNKFKVKRKGAGTKTAKSTGSAAMFHAVSVPLEPRRYEIEIHPLEDLDFGEVRFMIDQNMDETCRNMNSEPLVWLNNVKLNDFDVSEKALIKNDDGNILSILVPNIKEGKTFRLKFNFTPSNKLAIANDKFVGLKAEIIKRKHSKTGDTND